MTPDHHVLFGLGLETGVDQVSEILAHARVADEAGLDVVSLSDHPYFAERLDAYAALGFVLGATSNITGAVIMTNLLSRPAPILARTVTGLSTISRGRFVLGMGSGGMWEEIVALGVPQLSPAARVRALEEAITVVRALSGGGDPVTFDGEFYHVTELAPAVAPTPPIWVGSLGPKALAVTGRHADGWIPGHLADWRSARVAESRPIIDEAAASVGRDPSAIDTIYNVSGRIARHPLPETRDEEGRWIGGGVTQWVEELTFAALEHGAAAFIYLLFPGDIISDTTLKLWAQEVVPAVREAIADR
ncbi:MAG: LLM class flavin-dependent oxidoreductase [Acidimicrobiales bacterium]|jgi:alkanesulfonate monooxygenase SsuD/methylene tetrahydromethanopterin reductase-like flavin-dependent oxidoreductase (luciferase family)